MKWILVYIALSNHSFHNVVEQGRYGSMNECFNEREKIVETIGKPIINYQVICIPYSKERLLRDGKPHNKYD